MDRTLTKALVIGGSALAGGVAGSWASAQALARFGYRLGPWGMMAGAVLGALAGAAMSGKLGGQQSGPATLEGESELGTD